MLIDYNISKKAHQIIDTSSDGWSPLEEGGFSASIKSVEVPSPLSSLDRSIYYTHEACTPAYAAPEFIKNDFYSNSIDVWGIGLILYSLLFKKAPTPYEHYEVRSPLQTKIS